MPQHPTRPQHKASCRIHMLGTAKLSRTRPQWDRAEHDHPRSAGCGIVGPADPQAVDRRRGRNPPTTLSTANPQPPPRFPQLLHTAVHCSATRRARSPRRVKGVTPSCPFGLWGTRGILWAELWGSQGGLCTGCAEHSAVHSDPRLIHRRAHRAGGQNVAGDLRKPSYPRNPQGLLLRPHTETG